MADRYPLIVDSTTSTVKELPSGDNLNLSNSDIVNANLVSASSGIFSGSSSSEIFRITQTGTGDVLHVEDSTNPDNTRFVINNEGSVGVGTTLPSGKMHIVTDDEEPAIRIVQNNPSTSNFPIVVERNDRPNSPLFRISGIGSVGIGTTISSDFTIFKDISSGVGSGTTQGFLSLSYFGGAPNNAAIPGPGQNPSIGGPWNWARGWSYNSLTLNAQGDTSAGIATTTAGYFNNQVVLSFGNQDPRLLDKQHSANAFISFTCNDVANTLYGGGKLDFYIRANTAPYSPPNNPYVSSVYWMPSLFTIDGVSGNVGVGTSLPAHKLDVGGNLRVTGSLTKGSGTFNIKHPVDSTKRLVHSFIEGPRADLIYRGVVTLSAGSATVNIDEVTGMIPGTWAALCRQPQLFLQNNEDWTQVKGEVSDEGVITITAKTSTSTAKINWMVVAERQDDDIKSASWTDEDGHPILEPIA